MATDPNFSSPYAYIFPGQGSQSVGMGKSLVDTYQVAREIYIQADEILNFPLSKLSWEGPEDALNDTINTQPALLVHSIAALCVLQQLYPVIQPTYTAGHSLGEFSALVAADVLTFPEALLLVRKRGELMKFAGLASPGKMAAILGLDINTVERLCAKACEGNEIAQVANDNCPGQIVISGNINAIDRTIRIAQDSGARRAIPLSVSIASHSALMAPAQYDLNLNLSNYYFNKPSIPVIGNVTAKPMATVAAIHQDITAQLTSRLRWTESIQYIVNQGVSSFIEIGTGSVLTGLVKRIEPQSKVFSLSSPPDFIKFQSSITQNQ